MVRYTAQFTSDSEGISFMLRISWWARAAALCMTLAYSCGVTAHAETPIAAALTAEERTALDEYIAKPDPSYSWRLGETKEAKDHTVYSIELTSQTWRTAEEVDRPVWKHWVVIVKPKGVTSKTGFLFVSGGSHRETPPDTVEPRILAIAKAFGALGIKPKRSILFIATTAEEQGLLGAEYYARNPLVPLKDTVANINIDSMNVLGQTTDITPLGADRSTLGKVIEEVAKESNLTISPDAHPEQGSFYRSDHFPFAKAGVPAVNFEPGSKFVGHSEKWGEEQFADYNEHRYHQPSDEYSLNWDFTGMTQQGRLAFLIGLRVANANDTPQWNKGDEFERARLKALGRAQ